MAQIQKAVLTQYNDGQVVISNIRKARGTVPIFGGNETYSATLVDSWWDGTPMDDAKADGDVYFKYIGEEYPEYTGRYFELNLPNDGELFLEKDTVDELRAMSNTEILLLQKGYYKGVTLNGYYKANDTPGAIQYYLSDTEEEDDGGSIFEVGGIKLEHEFVDSINPSYYGAYGDGIEDDFLAMFNTVKKAKDLGIGVSTEKNHLISQSLDCRKIPLIIKGDIICQNDGVSLIVGGYSGEINPSQYIHRVMSFGDLPVTENPLCVVMGASRQNITVDRCRYLRIFASTDSSIVNASSTAYSNFYFSWVFHLELLSDFDTDGSMTQWINENNFYLNNTKSVHIDGTYSHNHNKFHNGCFEGSNAYINIVRGHSNFFYGMRVEGDMTITLGELTQSNTIITSYTYLNKGNFGKYAYNPSIVELVDEGVGNIYHSEDYSNYEKQNIFKLDNKSQILMGSNNNWGSKIEGFGTHSFFNTSSAQPSQFNCIPSFEGIYFTRYAPIFQSDFIDITTEDLIQIHGRSEIRITAKCYDENYVDITAPNQLTTLGYSSTYNIYNTEAIGFEDTINSTYKAFYVNSTSSQVRYIKILVTRNITLGNKLVDLLEVNKILKPYKRSEQDNKRIIQKESIVLEGIPTAGFSKIGDKIFNSLDSKIYNCSFSSYRQLATESLAGDNVLQIEDDTGLQNGDLIGVELINGEALWTTITSIESNIITINTNLVIDSKKKVFVARWSPAVPNATTSVKGLVNQSTPVGNITTPDATDDTEAIALVNELKAKINELLSSDRASGQRAT